MPRLKEAGHEVAVYCYAGLQHGAGLEINGIVHYPNYAQDFGNSFARRWYKEFRADLLISHQDSWVLSSLFPDMQREGYNVVCWPPIDHRPLPPPVKRSVEGVLHIIAMTRFAEDVFRAAGLDNVTYIPHACDPQIFYPENKAKCREHWNIPQDSFVLLQVVVNKGPRKNIVNFLRAVRDFLDRCPEARKETKLVLHSYVFHDNINPMGYDLPQVWGSEVLNITDVIKHPDPFEVLKGFDEDEMRMLYSSSDWMVSNSLAEGFGLPCLESLACGTPVIFTNFAGAKEAVGPGGLPIEIVDKIPFELSSSFQAFPSTDDTSRKIQIAYKDWKEGGKLRDELGEKGRQHVLECYTWDVVMPKWIALLEVLETAIKMKKREGIQLGRI